MTRDRYGKIHWVRLFRETMKGRVAGLSIEATGAYYRLFWGFIERKGPLPDDDHLLASIAQVTLRRWKTIRTELEKHRIYEIRGGFVHDDVAAERVQEFERKSQTNTENVVKRWDRSARVEDAS
jgi:uncharacterized protein YdaU (DUF1376 family)